MTALALTAVAYKLDDAAAASGIGRTNIDAAIKAGDLIAHYIGTKPVVLADDLKAWITNLPTERAR